MSSELDLRLRRIGDLPLGVDAILHASTIDLAVPYSDVPTISFTASQVVTGPIVVGQEVALELWNGTSWSEPEHSRYIVTGVDFDETDPAQIANVTLIGRVPFLFSKALLHSADGSERPYKDSAGLILLHTLTEAQARGAAKGVTYTFTETKDSNGMPWAGAAVSVSINLSADQSYLEILAALSTQGVIEWTVVGTELRVYNPGAGADLSIGDSPVYVGRRATSAPVKSSIIDASTVAIARGDAGSAKEFAGTDELNLGRLERATSLSGVSDDATVSVLGQLWADEGRTKQQHTVTEQLRALDSVPLIDYKLGSYVNVRRRLTGAWEKMRVVQVQARKEQDGKISLDVILQDRLEDFTARLAKRAGTLGNGVGGNGRAKFASSGGAGSGQIGTIDAAHVGSGPAKVNFNGTLTDPLPYLAGYLPFANDTVEVLDGVILGRVVGNATGTPSQGTTEPVELGDGWDTWDPGRYGDPTIHRSITNWIRLSGCIVAGDSSTADFLMRIPGVYRPPRAPGYTMRFKVAIGDTVSSSSGVAHHTELVIDPATGNVSLNQSAGTSVTVAPGTVVSLAGVGWNISQSFTTTAASAGYGKDEDGLAWAFGTDGRSTSAWSMLLPDGYRGDTDRTLFSYTYNGIAGGGGDNTATYLQENSTAHQLWMNSGPDSLDGTFWQAADGAPKFSWTRLNLINGFTHKDGVPVEYAVTDSGLVLLRGGHANGIAGQSMGTLPPGFRPTAELMTAQNVRITPAGNLVTSTAITSTIASQREFMLMFPAAR